MSSNAPIFTSGPQGDRSHGTVARRRDAIRRAFTLIELLVVIIIIGILIGIIFAVAGALTQGGRIRQTEDTIRVAETALQTYLTEAGDEVPAFVQAPPPSNVGDEIYYPVFDGVRIVGNADQRSTVNSMGLFVEACRDAGLEDVFTTLPPDLYAQYDGDAPVLPDETISEPGDQPPLFTVLDAWGQPLRFVHPRFDGVLPFDALNDSGDRVLTEEGMTIDLQADGLVPQGLEDASLAEEIIRSVRRNTYGGPEMDPEFIVGMPNISDPVQLIGDSDGGTTADFRPYIYSAGSPVPGAENLFNPAKRFVPGEGRSREPGDNVYAAARPVFPDFQSGAN